MQSWPRQPSLICWRLHMASPPLGHLQVRPFLSTAACAGGVPCMQGASMDSAAVRAKPCSAFSHGSARWRLLHGRTDSL